MTRFLRSVPAAQSAKYLQSVTVPFGSIKAVLKLIWEERCVIPVFSYLLERFVPSEARGLRQ
jgi:hypothetical protein